MERTRIVCSFDVDMLNLEEVGLGRSWRNLNFGIWYSDFPDYERG